MAHNLEIVRDAYNRLSDDDYAFTQTIITGTLYCLTPDQIRAVKANAKTPEDFHKMALDRTWRV